MLQVRGNDSLLLWGATAVVITVIIGMWQHRRKRNSIPTKWREVGTLSDMQMYPIKSGTAMVLKEALCTQYGLQTMGDVSPVLRDRCFLVYSEKNGEFKTARTFNNMVFIKLTPDGEGFVKLSAPKMPDIKVKIPNISEKCKIRQCTIWNDVKITALDCGDEIAAWLSKYILNLDNGLRLGHSIPESMPLRSVADKHRPLKYLRDIDTGAYPDVSSYMLMAQSSIDDLQTRVPPHIKVSHRQFRPNFVVKGSQPYEEDKWQWIKIGETATFRAVKPCTRCLFTTIDPDTGIMEGDREPLRTLRQYRISDNLTMMKIGDRSPVFGMHYGIYKQGPVHVGDKIYVGETWGNSIY